jgi:hypothetical protein
MQAPFSGTDRKSRRMGDRRTIETETVICQILDEFIIQEVSLILVTRAGEEGRVRVVDASSRPRTLASAMAQRPELVSLSAIDAQATQRQYLVFLHGDETSDERRRMRGEALL